MRQKEFTKKQVRTIIKKVRKDWKSKKLDGKNFSLRSVLGDYQNISMLRYIKEILFYNVGESTRGGAVWYLKYPKKGSKKLSKEVMKAVNVTKLF